MALPPDAFRFDTNIEGYSLRPDTGELGIKLIGGVDATVELRAGSGDAATLRAGRPVLYLDQNQWSKLSSWAHGDGNLSAREAAAAQVIVERVESKQLLLPASAGHFVETVPMYGEPRLALASTVLRLSGGWQMRNPLHVRVEEMTRALSGRSPAAADVFAPGADVFYAWSRIDAHASLPPELREVSREVSNALSLYDAIADPDAIEDEGRVAEAAAERWAAAHAELARRLSDGGADREMARRAVHANLLLDLADDLVRVGKALGISSTEVIDGLTGSDDPVGTMPFLARMRALLFGRIRNVGQRWEANDLVDSLFLSCAAGYADVIIGERTTIGYLRQGRGLPPGADLATTLGEGVALLDRRLAPASARSVR